LIQALRRKDSYAWGVATRGSPCAHSNPPISDGTSFQEASANSSCDNGLLLVFHDRRVIRKSFRLRHWIGAALQLGFVAMTGTTLRSLEYVPVKDPWMQQNRLLPGHTQPEELELPRIDRTG